MRLLHTTELRFEEFNERNLPEYAILSHRWGPDEVSYQDFLVGRKKDGAGYEKIVRSCEIAARGFLQEDFEIHPNAFATPYQAPSSPWIWIDTCCIDKTNGAELSEAINSMYRWYERSCVCYVYLTDVTRCGEHANIEEHYYSKDYSKTMVEFKASQWFTRGWTLQELLAPKLAMFLDKKWTVLGSKRSLAIEISAATNIAQRRLDYDWYRVDGISVAEKLRWAASRKTERIEDEAYCLLGLFNINMPLLYGEGQKAFQRLQMEIIRASDDESIFVFSRSTYFGVLSDPRSSFPNFVTKSDIALSPVPRIHRAAYSITNKGLEFQVPKKLAKAESFILPLSCRADNESVFAIALQLDQSHGYFYREVLMDMPEKNEARTRYRGLYIVPITQLWSRDDLRKSGSELIYIKLFTS